MSDQLQILHAALFAVCPDILGLTAVETAEPDEIKALWPDAAVGRDAGGGLWRVDFLSSATGAERAAALSTLAAFDPEAPENLPREPRDALNELDRLKAVLMKRDPSLKDEIEAWSAA